MVNLILSGSKTMTVGERSFHYDPATYFVMSVDLPAVGQVHPDTDGRPYLAVSLTLDPHVVANLIADLPSPAGGCSVKVASQLRLLPTTCWILGCAC